MLACSLIYAGAETAWLTLLIIIYIEALLIYFLFLNHVTLFKGRS